MQKKGFFLLALICGLIAAGSTYMYLTNAKRNPPVTLKPLVVTTSNVPARTIIQANQLTIKDVPSIGYPQGGVSNIQSVVGSVALVNLKAGDPIITSMLEIPKEATSSTPLTPKLAVPDGKRAVAIPIHLVSGVGYSVKPGDFVDILVTMDIKANTQNAQPIPTTTLVAQNVLVLSTGESQTNEKQQAEAKSYTLALTVPQAMAVTLGSEKGSLRLLLRNPANQDIRQDQPVDQSIFIDPNYHNRFK